MFRDTRTTTFQAILLLIVQGLSSFCSTTTSKLMIRRRTGNINTLLPERRYQSPRRSHGRKLFPLTLRTLTLIALVLASLIFFAPTTLIHIESIASGYQSRDWEAIRHLPSQPREVQLLQNNVYSIVRLKNSPTEPSSVRHHLTWDLFYGIVRKVREPEALREGCVHVADWQTSYHPTCNDIHELDLGYSELINHGGFRDIWKVDDIKSQPRVLKTLRYIERRNFDLRNFDRHRRDAVAFDQLSYSPYVADIYGNCANSALFDYMDGGTLYDYIEDNVSSRETLQVAYDVTMSVAHAHNFDEQGRPSIAHTDIKPDQWIRDSSGTFRLADFNRARFLGWNETAKETCPFSVDKNGGIWRSPEELNYEDETEKVDIWSLGNVLHFLLTHGAELFPDMASEDMMDAVKDRKRPVLPEVYEDPFSLAIVHALDLCFVVNPKERASARDVAHVLKKALDS